MGLCMEACCNAEARARIEAEKARTLAENTARFEAWDAARQTAGKPAQAVLEPLTVTPAPTPEENDLTHVEAIARRVALVRDARS